MTKPAQFISVYPLYCVNRKIMQVIIILMHIYYYYVLFFSIRAWYVSRISLAPPLGFKTESENTE